MYIFSNVLGVFVFDEKGGLADKILFESIDQYGGRQKYIDEIKNRYQVLKEPDEKNLQKILLYFKDKEFFGSFYNKNLEITKIDVRNSVVADTLIIQSIKSIDEIDKSINLLSKRLREWYGLYNPETSRAIESHEIFVQQIIEKDKKELLQELNINPKDSIGADLLHEDLEPLKSLAHEAFNLFQLRKTQIDYMSNLMDLNCPNLKAVCGILVAAKLVEHAGSLRRLSMLPSSTVQILGAETALFRHLKTGANPPRHGVIASHILLAKAPDKMHGKIARSLADKISIAVKIDYFKGQFIGDKLAKELEDKFK